MSNVFKLKDRVILKQNEKEQGIIVAVLIKGKYKVLWDRDWATGKTHMHTSKDLALAARA